MYFTKKQVTAFKNRIIRAKNSFSIGTDLMLIIDIEQMSDEQVEEMYYALLEKEVTYAELTTRFMRVLAKKIA